MDITWEVFKWAGTIFFGIIGGTLLLFILINFLLMMTSAMHEIWIEFKRDWEKAKAKDA